jgi:hypothetical protein
MEVREKWPGFFAQILNNDFFGLLEKAGFRFRFFILLREHVHIFK